MSIKSYIKKLERRQERWEKVSGETWHRKGYHRFFEGYTEYRVQENGKLKLKRVYTEDYYCPDLEKKQRLQLKLVYTVLFLSSAAMFLIAGFIPAWGNMYWIVNILQLVSAITFFLLGSSVFYNLTAGEKMEIRIYNCASDTLKARAKMLSLALVLTAAAITAYGLSYDFQGCLDELLVALLFAGAAGLAYLIFYLENKVKYFRVKNNNKIENGAIDPCEIRGAN